MSKRRRESPKKWLLLQARIERDAGKELRLLAERDGLPASAYVRRLVMRHLEECRTGAMSMSPSFPMNMPTGAAFQGSQG
jgi:hypothetical protein